MPDFGSALLTIIVLGLLSLIPASKIEGLLFVRAGGKVAQPEDTGEIVLLVHNETLSPNDMKVLREIIIFHKHPNVA